MQALSWISPSFSAEAGRKRKRDIGGSAPTAKLIEVDVLVCVDNGREGEGFTASKGGEDKTSKAW